MAVADPSYREFFQREDLTTRLRNILEEYPRGVGPFKEFLQNTDDARARRFALCLDRRAYPSASLLDGALAPLQGPALLVFNDASFSEGDFESISHVGQSGKLEDANTIGKYGLGAQRMARVCSGLFVQSVGAASARPNV